MDLENTCIHSVSTPEDLPPTGAQTGVTGNTEVHDGGGGGLRFIREPPLFSNGPHVGQENKQGKGILDPLTRVSRAVVIRLKGSGRASP